MKDKITYYVTIGLVTGQKLWQVGFPDFGINTMVSIDEDLDEICKECLRTIILFHDASYDFLPSPSSLECIEKKSKKLEIRPIEIELPRSINSYKFRKKKRNE